MNALRSTLVFAWLVLTLIPCGRGLLIASLLEDLSIRGAREF